VGETRGNLAAGLASRSEGGVKGGKSAWALEGLHDVLTSRARERDPGDVGNEANRKKYIRFGLKRSEGVGPRTCNYRPIAARKPARTGTRSRFGKQEEVVEQ